MTSIALGVNIDHVATLRQARRTDYPEPLAAAQMAVQAGADSITVHLREDRRHIQEHDVCELIRQIKQPINLEMAATEAMVAFACEIGPAYCCLVPERRAELTTEGGLDVCGQLKKLTTVCQQLIAAGIQVSLFIDAVAAQIEAAYTAGAPCVELHTGPYATTPTAAERNKIIQATEQATALGLQVNAGHGLHYENVQAIANIQTIQELNIGHSIVARAIFVGFTDAVSEMKHCMQQARQATIPARD